MSVAVFIWYYCFPVFFVCLPAVAAFRAKKTGWGVLFLLLGLITGLRGILLSWLFN